MRSRPANSVSSFLVKDSPLVAKGWLTIQEVADILNISRDTVERWISTGALRAIDVSARKSSPRRPNMASFRRILGEILGNKDKRGANTKKGDAS